MSVDSDIPESLSLNLDEIFAASVSAGFRTLPINIIDLVRFSSIKNKKGCDALNIISDSPNLLFI